MNKITTLATETANKAEEMRDDVFQLREYIKQKMFDAYLMGMEDANTVWEKETRAKSSYEIDNPRL